MHLGLCLFNGAKYEQVRPYPKFDLKLSTRIQLIHLFTVAKQIPRGKVATYGQIARIIGAPRAARYVGYALRANPSPGTEPESIPCHRVVFKDGRMATGFAFGGPEIQQQMLEEEGVGFDEEGKVAMESFLWNGVPADE